MNKYAFFKTRNRRDKATKLLKKVASIKTQQGLHRIQTDIISFLSRG